MLSLIFDFKLDGIEGPTDAWTLKRLDDQDLSISGRDSPLVFESTLTAIGMADEQQQGSPTPMKRVSRACTFCRARKSRCDL